MSNVMGGETELAVGDTIQLDKGLHIVECVGKDTADCLPLDDKNKGKPRTVQTPFPRHLVISRGGKPALDKFLSQPPKAKPGHVLLEPGDRLVHMGGHCTVVSVLDKKCVIGNLDGREFYEDRLVNEYRLTDVCTHKPVRLNEAERAANLEQFLQQRKSPQPETKETSDEQEKETKPMAKKAKTVKTAKAKKIKSESKTTAVSYAGRPEFIAELIAKGEKDAAIMEAVKVKYPGSSKGNVEKTIAAKRAKAEKSKNS